MTETAKGSIIIDEKKCISCGICVSLCPHNALSLENGIPVTTGKCKVCGICSASCVTKAISMKSKKFTDDGLLESFNGNLKDPKIAVFSCRKLVKELIKEKKFENAGIISMMCSGRIDMTMMAEAFRRGAWGIIVAGCQECSNKYGSKEAMVKVDVMKKVLEQMGENPGRIMFIYGNPEEEITRFSEKLNELGKPELDFEIVKEVVEDRVLRSFTAKKRSLVEEGNVYGEKVDVERMNKLIEDSIAFAINAGKLLRVMDYTSIEELAEKTGMDSREVVKTILEMRRRGMINFETKDELKCVSGV
ncbi:Coenzyme F420-reducing hydrogenase, delta subunit [Archaeoglobus sulfaticallidus PM70-1]|uniref:Coenzyme F420-reducing hydrogenase, delta subunit n=1 Tax=Archaeoglobus sulfaticallidus PM70-1 TaxID=387631 RepID=N0BMD1_9EURY|nr:hydrogenase iron-sulfur subunit [Archaeoglobus sulfaticallidus]AGK61786.1 Coenzyme F420-reducing hydrogenase, delta subunit [Archaeoglobus sulfaticallidus PM70-1]